MARVAQAEIVAGLSVELEAALDWGGRIFEVVTEEPCYSEAGEDSGLQADLVGGRVAQCVLECLRRGRAVAGDNRDERLVEVRRGEESIFAELEASASCSS